MDDSIPFIYSRNNFIQVNSTALEKMNSFSVMILIMFFLQCYAEREIVPQEPVEHKECGPNGGLDCLFKSHPVIPLDDEDCRSDGCRFKSPAADQQDVIFQPHKIVTRRTRCNSSCVGIPTTDYCRTCWKVG
ncbi:uncharacterized protein [Parasteatoda tepidariorum]|uniref:uncharacterized protein isoform X1 n=1 Tax=Parasteatoda tepidariorum TaxID=114398 RepID=UPI0039BC5347